MELIDNINKTLKDDLTFEIKDGSKMSIAAACFSIYAFQELKKELKNIDELRFIFTSPTFVTEKAQKEKREFYIPRLNRERSLYGTEFEVKLRNELNQKAIAKECADWIRKKVVFKSNVTNENMMGFINVDVKNYMPVSGFTTVDLGCERGNNAYNMVQKTEAPFSNAYIELFNNLWNDNAKLQTVTEEVIDNITAAYNENSPEFIYFVTLYNIFNEFLEDISEDVLPNEATGFKQSKIWNMLYNFQKDAALAIINKLEKYNGCILADSVGLGKTFTALAVIKYYENRNKTVLVLCPKKLSNNWNTYKDNYINNPVAADRLNYDVLFHTDLNRNHGKSNGLDLDRLNWGNYDLVVIDESHNFRSGGKLSEEEKENRYLRLLNKVIRKGVKTKVLMLSATPVNNRFNDLKNQLQLAYEGDASLIDDKLNISRSIDDIFKNAQKAFNTWCKFETCDRTTGKLLKMLDFDFFEVLDSVTIARSRKQIEKYYDTADIGKFPTRLKPISLSPHLTDLKSAINYNEIFEQLMQLSLTIYTPTHYILPSRLEKYAELYEDNKVNIGFTQANREQGIRRLTAINLMKRMESSVYSFNLTLKRIKDLIEDTINIIDSFNKQGSVKLNPTEIKHMAAGIHNLIQGVFDESVLDDMIEDGNRTKIPNELNDNFFKKEFQTLWNYINHKYAYTVEFDSNELIRKSITHINDNLFVSQLQYTASVGQQKKNMDVYEIERGESFIAAETSTKTLKHAKTSKIKYDLIGKIAEGTALTRRTVANILHGVAVGKLQMFKNNPEEFISKVIRLIKEQKATMIVEHISYDRIEGEYDSAIFTAEKHSQNFENAFRAEKHIQDYVFTDGTAEKSVERRFVQDLEIAKEVCVYAKLPKGFAIPTPVGNYSPDWAIAFNEGTVKHIYFIAETKGTMESLNLRPIEQAKISCAKKLFNEISTSKVKYHDVDSYQSLLNIMNSL